MHAQIRRIRISELKGIKNCEIEITRPLTAIMGVNGIGKSTIIHALTCCFKPETQYGGNLRFPAFFPPTPNATWKNSKFCLELDLVDDGGNFLEKQTVEYAKAIDRWTPRNEKKPIKDVKFIGIDTCLPDIERFNLGRINFSTFNQSDEASIEIVKKAGYILNKDYEYLTRNNGNNKSFIGVKTKQNLSYSSLSMGAGEQRVFRIISELVKAPRFAIILIDEIDLLLHSEALKKLVKTMKEIAEKKHLQIIFTTHSLIMEKLEEEVDIKYLDKINEDTVVYNGLSTLAWQDMSGESKRPILVFVEDDLSELLVKEIAHSLNIKNKVQIEKYGAIENAFVIASSIILRHEKTENVMILTDGDKYLSDEDKLLQIKKHFSGSEIDADERRRAAVDLIYQYNLPIGISPEEYLHLMLIELNVDDEIVREAKKIKSVKDSHEWIYNIANKMDDSSEFVYKEIIKLCKSSRCWSGYVKPVEEWLAKRRSI